MDNIVLWSGLALVVALLTFLNQKQVYSSKVKRAYGELRELTVKIRSGQSENADVSRWESALAEMGKHPNEFNKLEAEIGFRRAFVTYLEQHYPQDPRLPELREAAAFQKDSVWGIKMGDYGSKK
ncbi:hypothetical protein A3842_26055 [Paenibacillus sp. P3E]|uniref:hypothetical protein n=1 Tax=unclassified Paenibacillus TaxID=185978 RepID=UPI0009404A11|nr:MULTISPECIES: hypothetical protein [unclassified Paenibacillus]OKP69565.1 hypothetical protein A3842_26055 [Paenibacillus sp. P3E]OKP89986.1 hypothetical protein A3848_14605 [Paenibacillus sp. P32E]